MGKVKPKYKTFFIGCKQQKVAEAKGKAEALTIESNALRSNPEVLQLRALEKWNGVLPQVTNGGVPFINLNK